MHTRYDGQNIGPALKQRAIPAALMLALAAAGSAEAQDDAGEGVTSLTGIVVTDDPSRILPNEVSESSFGFSKPLLETPRTVSFVSSEMIDLFGISATEDLPRAVPGVYTLTRYGIQGGIDVRDVSADIYFRGMKRLNMEGHARTVLAAMDSIEVVKGPPSPIYGMGKIGGYTNLSPKSGRARTGAYLTDAEGFAQFTAGSYGRGEFTFGGGGPLSLFDRNGGYYVFGLIEDSDTYTRGVPIKTKMVQAAISLDGVFGRFRMEAGTSAQVTRTAGAVLGRLTQDTIDTGRYIRGTPLIHLDLNNNGSIGVLEYNTASPVEGNLSVGNQPLLQRYALPVDADGNPIPLTEVPVVPGIPQSLYDYLEAHPEHDPTGLLRAQGVGGPVPLSGYVPLGMFLDPLTIGFDTLDLRRSASFEREQEGKLLTAYIDFIDDLDPDRTIKNQLFFDYIDSYKLSDMGLYGPRESYVIEDKVTLTKRTPAENLPDWLRINRLMSFNLRLTDSENPGGSFYSDPSANRVDAMAPTWVDSRGGFTPNTTFVSCGDNPDLFDDGAPCTAGGSSRFWETGVGVMFDIDLFSRTNVIVGGRYDYSEAKARDPAGVYNRFTGTSMNPGAFRPADLVEKGSDSGTSWSLSLSRRFGSSTIPYITVARSSLTLDSSANEISRTVIQAGHIGEAELKEIGVKTSALDDKIFFSIAGYEQSRISVASADDPTASAEVTSTVGRGWEAELKWVPIRNLFMSLYARNQTTKFTPNTGGSIAVNARALGFQDVVDEAGNVIYPAEAFMYGGRVEIVLPDGIEAYEKQQGRPETQYGLNANYQLNSGLGFTLSANYFSEVHGGRLKFLRLPSYTTVNAGVFWEVSNWRVKADVYNLTDVRSFRSQRIASGEVLAIANPDRRWQVSVTASF